MNAPAIERFLARLYTETALREAFLSAPEQVALNAGLEPETALALARIDRDGLRLAADSFARKRDSRR